jgi:hypothetical protein
MGNRLYVGNLSDDASTEALRKCFAECGVVSDVQIATDRSSGRMRGYAFVTMATDAEARVAITKMNGAMFDDRPLRVNEAGEQREGESRSAKADAVPRVKITSQFRERHNMVYELDCLGTTLTLRVFPTPTETGGEEWRLEARTSSTTSAVDAMVAASAPTRAEALDKIGHEWFEKTAELNLPTVDWGAIALAMKGVRGI